MSKKRPQTDAEKQARREADAAIKAAAAEAMEADDIDEQVAELITEAPSLNRYSLGNVLLILVQAAERGIPVTDIRPMTEWNKAGRKVITGQAGIRIWAPRRKSKKELAEEAESGKTSSRDHKGFVMVSVFDISQTEPGRRADEPEAAALLNQAPPTLAEQISTRMDELTSLGYEVTVMDDPACSQVEADHESRAVVIGEHGEDAEILAGLLAAVREATARKDRERTAVPVPREPVEKPVRLSI